MSQYPAHMKTSPAIPLPAVLQALSHQPVVSMMTSLSNGGRHGVPGEISRTQTLWLDTNTAGVVLGQRLAARSLATATSEARKLAALSVRQQEIPEDHGAPRYESLAAPQAVVRDASGVFYAAALDDAPAWAADSRSSHPLELLTEQSANRGKNATSFIGANQALSAVVSPDWVWRIDNGDAVRPTPISDSTQTARHQGVREPNQK